MRVLQRSLTRVGLRVKADGVYGPATVRRVRRLQRGANLPVNGVFARTEAQALRRLLRGTTAGRAGGFDSDNRRLGSRTLRRDMAGRDVYVLQGMLQRAGYVSESDGAFGPFTEQAVREFEAASFLPVDGVVTGQFISRLRRTLAGGPPPVPPPGMRAKVGRNGLAVAPAQAPPVVKAIIAAGNVIAKKPYRYGGGHGRWNDTGYDCSGSISYALHGADLLSSPLDSTGFERWGAAGAGQWVTIYANSGHAYMIVAGLRFDTSGARQTGSRWQTAQRSSRGFVVRHPVGL